MSLDCLVWQRSWTWSLDLLASVVDPWRALQRGEVGPFGRLLFLALVPANISLWCRNATGFVAGCSKLFACFSSSVTIVDKKQGCMTNPSCSSKLLWSCGVLVWLFQKSIYPRSCSYWWPLCQVAKWHLTTFCIIVTTSTMMINKTMLSLSYHD